MVSGGGGRGRLEAIITPVVEAAKGEQKLTRLEQALERIRKKAVAVNRELRTLQRLSQQINRGPGGGVPGLGRTTRGRASTPAPTGGPLDNITFNRRANRYQDLATGRFVPKPPQLRDTENENMARFFAKRSNDEQKALRMAHRNNQEFLRQQKALFRQNIKEQAKSARGRNFNQRRFIGANDPYLRAIIAHRQGQMAHAAEVDARRKSIMPGGHINRGFQQWEAQAKANRALRRRNMYEKQYQRLLAANEKLARSSGRWHRRNSRYSKQSASNLKRTLVLMRSNLSSGQKLNLVWSGILAGIFKSSTVMKSLPPRIRLAVKAAVVLGAVWAGVTFGILLAVRSVQQLVSEAGRAGATMEGVYRSAAAGTAIGLPMQEAMALTASLASEMSSNLAEVATNAKAVDEINKVLLATGSKLTFQDLFQSDTAQREMMAMKELLRIEKQITNEGARRSAQVAFLEGVSGFSAMGDEAFPLLSAFRRGQGSRVLEGYFQANPVDEETFNAAARLAGAMDRIMLSGISLIAALGSAAEPIFGNFLTEIASLLERIGRWLERNPQHIQRFLKGMLAIGMPFIHALDVILHLFIAIGAVVAGIVYLLGWMVELLGPIGHIFSRPLSFRAYQAITPGEPDDGFDGNDNPFAGGPGGGPPGGAGVSYNSTQIINTNDTFQIDGAQDPQATADAVSQTQRINIQMHGARP